jgi:chromosome segregation protein
VRRHVRSRAAAVDALLDRLVGSAVVVEGGWTVALDTALAHPNLVVVTRTGDRFGRDAWRVGTGAVGATGAALDEARRSAARAQADRDRRNSDLQLARGALEAARRADSDASTRLDAADAAFGASTDALARVQSERARATVEADAVRSAVDDAADRSTRLRRRRHELEGVLPALEARESAAAQEARARQQARAELEDRAAALAARRRHLDVARAGLEERHSLIVRRRAEIEARLEADVAGRAQAAARRVELERTLGALDRLAARVSGHHETLAAHLEELHAERRRQTDAIRAVTDELDSLRHQRVSAERRLEEIRERTRRVELDHAETALRIEAAVDALHREHDADVDRAIATAAPPLPDGVSPAARARDLERELRLLGPINPLALEEFTALQERHTFLEEQLEDVKTTRRELARIIKAVDAEIEQVFAAAYADVSANFELLFERLFPGGSGRLLLTRPDDLLETGIEVEARPSGKNVKKLSLLSGGERSLTALAFLFAVFRSRPSPFYVMDEVEAALDDVNLHRFLSLLEEFRREAQLIIVSHQKRTMEAADSLLGVTMAPGGSSKVVTERVTASA